MNYIKKGNTREKEKEKEGAQLHICSSIIETLPSKRLNKWDRLHVVHNSCWFSNKNNNNNHTQIHTQIVTNASCDFNCPPCFFFPFSSFFIVQLVLVIKLCMHICTNWQTVIYPFVWNKQYTKRTVHHRNRKQRRIYYHLLNISFLIKMYEPKRLV